MHLDNLTEIQKHIFWYRLQWAEKGSESNMLNSYEL